ncbi:hypothetical protein JAAARDRAFT_50998 [Jaapia argillacea MUCL 33604]|uniref:Uncharacterized protein n=1 Tax=Jaapia argillacea MUCL 33604 TaxID=933084 RepID=A0A067PIY1_9AGAM|nr:hypothetical protein JAAARDRAFT_50998 [Jaapia argillacea MUCL 33604]
MALYQGPDIFSSTTARVVLTDPKAVAHFLESIMRISVLPVSGGKLGQIKALLPTFSNTAIKKLTGAFFDSTYKLKDASDAILELTPTDEAIVEVGGNVSPSNMMVSKSSLIRDEPSFHDFESLHGKHSTVADIFDCFSKIKPSIIQILSLILVPTFPSLMNLSLPRPSRERIAPIRIFINLTEGSLLIDEEGGWAPRDGSIIAIYFSNTYCKQKVICDVERGRLTALERR